MEGLWITVAACVLVSCSVKGNYWLEEALDGTQRYKKWAPSSNKVSKTWPVNLKHPLFQCPDMSPSPSVPTSVEFVKPADIKVIAALGDSLTTAPGANATTVLGLPIEFRQLSWSIGGYGTFQDVITLPNIIKLFNPNLVGASPRKTIHGMQAHLKDTGFNLAVTGENTFNLPSQTRHLIETLKSYEGLNFEEDWKLLTILIGMNDICDYCKDKTLFSVDNYIHYLTVSLEMLMNEIPRMIVNVVQILPMKTLREVKKPTPACLLQKSFCPCLIKPASNSPELQELVKVNLDYQKRLEGLLYSPQFFREDFAIILQPFLKFADAPRLPNGKVDMTYFTHDCFHFTVKGHEELAKGLWNNMFQPAGRKTIVSSFSEPIKLICPPAEHPYIFTNPIMIRAAPPVFHSGASSWTATVLLVFLHMTAVYFSFS